MPKFRTKTYNEAIELAAKLLTIDSNSTGELAMITYIYNQHPHKVIKDITKFHKKWSKLIEKPIKIP